MNTDDQDDTRESDGGISFGGSTESSGPLRPTVPFGETPLRRPPDPQDEDVERTRSGKPTSGRAEGGFGAGGQAAGRRPAMVDVDLTGQLLDGKYRVLRLIGRGSFGAVYEAVDQMMKAPVAIKVLAHAAAADTDSLEQFLGEARLLTHLDHPCVVRWITFDQTPAGLHFFVMELLKGRELADLLARVKRLAPERAIRMLLQVLSALRAAHFLPDGKCLLHLDLKPSNIFVIDGPPETVKVIDFGMSQHVGSVVRASSGAIHAAPNRAVDLGATIAASTLQPGRCKQSGLTVTRARGGTFAYASPEQCMHLQGEDEIVELDGRSDLYSLGIVAYEMLTGQLPWQCRTVAEIVRAHIELPVPRIARLGVKVPWGFQAWLDRCLAKKREDRFADVKEALTALERVAHPPSMWPMAAVAAFTLLLAIFWWSGSPNHGLFMVDEADRVLYFGPEQRDRIVPLANLQAAVDSGPGSWRDSQQVEVAGLSGWNTAVGRVDGKAELRLQVPPEPPQARVDLSAYLHVGKARDTHISASSLRIVYLPKDSWSVGDLRIAGVQSGQPVDPEGAVLEIPLRGIAAGDLAKVVVAGPDGIPHGVPIPSDGGAADWVCRCDLQPLGLQSGGHVVQVTTVDKAGNRVDASIRLDVDPNPLEFTARLEGVPDRVNYTGASCVLYRGSDPRLVVTPNRPAQFEVSVEISSPVGATPPKVEDPATREGVTSWRLPGLVGGDTPVYGHVMIRARDQVVHKSAAKGQAERRLPFSYQVDEVSLTRRLLRSDGRPLDSMQIEARNVYSTNEPSVTLELQRGAIAIYVDIEVVRDAGSRQQLPRVSLPTPFQPKTVNIPLGEDGRYVFRVLCYRVTAAAVAVGSSPDHEQLHVFEVRKDTVGPTVKRIGEAGEGPRFFGEGMGKGDNLVSLEVGDVGEGAHLECIVEGKSHKKAFELRPVTDGPFDVTWEKLQWPLEAIEDGPYTAVVKAVDAAGNGSTPVECSFEVARRGPDLKLAAPVVGLTWQQKGNDGRLQVLVHATDPNGVDRVTGRLRTMPGKEPAFSAELAFHRDGSTIEWTAWVAPPPDLAGARVELLWSGVDKHGNQAVEQHAEFKLEDYAGAYALGAAIRRKGTTVPPTSMRFVKGADSYTFGGRVDDKREFVKAELQGVPANFITTNVAVADFYLDEHEVTVQQYLEFLSMPDGYLNGRNWAERQPDPARAQALRTSLQATAASMPITGVDWHEACAYATWVGKRLPKLVEYEYAVRGGKDYRMAPWTGSLRVPDGPVNWGRAPNAELKVVTFGEKVGDVTPDAKGARGGGIRHLFSNAAEWLEAASAAQAWAAPASFAYPRLPHFRLVVLTDKQEASPARGFRCAVDAKVAVGISRGDANFDILQLPQ